MEKASPFATIQAVAERAGVSTMTVSRVLNNNVNVSAKTRQRVEQAVRELQYVPNGLTRGFSGRRTRTIGILVSDITNPFYTSIVRGVDDIAQRHRYNMFLGSSDDMREKEERYIAALIENRADGVLIAVGSIAPKSLKLLTQRAVPFVLIDRDIDGIQADVVVGDNAHGGQMLTNHLIGLGHRRIALISGPSDIPSARERRHGYEATLHEHGIALDPSLVVETSYDAKGGYQAMQSLLRLPKEQQPSAVFAGNNFIGVGAITALREANVAIPQDMALVCYDDIELAAMVSPFLTVVAQPARTFGTTATQFLIERLETAEEIPPRRVVLLPKLIVRVSCGA